MEHVQVGGWEFELGVAVVDGRAWWACPIGGERCGLVLAAFGSIGLDCMAWHIEHAHVHALTHRLGGQTRRSPEAR